MKSGTTTARPKCAGNSRRIDRATPPESMALATIEPITQAATFVRVPFDLAASSRIRGVSNAVRAGDRRLLHRGQCRGARSEPLAIEYRC
jgi:hypothetical protein